ncbi:hypothetical protein PPYR_08784 [Photinus pyralis]|uniref:Tyr recombinase domain-containing protein n=1 Tax=Photinus pyralis TaxID=7054 RepID=A0A5N4AKF5_PHOPY|nr:hypothetical protein PPYR_08784 [Photinus pyralis]
MLKIKENVDISKFLIITEYMKNNSVGDEAKKSWVLQRKEIQEFMLNAPDINYLLVKVVTGFGIFGACRRQELHDLTVQDVTTEGSVLLVKDIISSLIHRFWEN